MTRHQATRANRAQVEQHIKMQRELGEEMPTYKEVTPRQLAVSIALIGLFLFTLHILKV